MKAFSAVVLFFFVSAGAQAQRRGGAPVRATPAPAFPSQSIPLQRQAPPAVVPSAGALGGAFASVGMSRPLGGIAPPSFPSAGVQRRHYPGTGYRYAGPIYYIPNAYDTAYQPYSYSTFNQPANPALYYSPAPGLSAPQPPVIINQYFGSRTAITQTEGETTSTAEATPGDPIGPPPNYYLIAYKDHNVYSVLAYWLEGETLHYVTTQNTHNQASLALIDLDRTTKLNAGNSVPFSLTGK